MNLIAFALRGGSAASKFLLVMYIATTSGSQLLGQVAILTTLTAFFTQVAGLEINQVLGRRLHGLDAEELSRTLCGQAIASLCIYAVLIPGALLVYIDQLGPYWFYIGLILILEHFITEVYRLNILLLRSIFASCLLFIKNAGWVLLFVGLTITNIERPSFTLLLYCWSFVLLLISIPLFASAWRHLTIHNGRSTAAALHLVPPLVKEASPFLVSATITAGAGAIDRLIISKSFTESELGIYFFFSTCASILTLVVAFGIGSTAGPDCIKIHTTQGHETFLNRLRHLKKRYWITVFSTAALILSLAWPLLIFFKRDIFFENIIILVCLVINAAFISLCDPYKLEEYLSKRDSSLIIGNSFHFTTILLAISAGAYASEINVVAVGIMLSSILTFIFFYIKGPHRVAQLIRLSQ